ncbi:MAG: LLM class flavin-dependent oxidoreductase, partial [Chromatiales bacterium]|nr:LLM class flavin-dependent oxidoreductase [Chromatiales bacterium]
RALLDGDEIDYTLDGETHPIRFQMREHRFIDLEPRIDLYIAGNGPRLQALAGEMADGLITALPRGGTIAGAMDNVRRGAASSGRTLPASFHTSAMVNVALLEPGEAANSERVLSQWGAAAITGLHYLVAQHLEFGTEPPPYAQGIWDAYLAWLNEAPPEVRHQRLHNSHYSFLDPEEARFITPELLTGSCIIGEPDAVIEQLREREADGLQQVMLYPPLKTQYRTIEDFAEQIIERM